jgi:hypothetical protein
MNTAINWNFAAESRYLRFQYYFTGFVAFGTDGVHRPEDFSTGYANYNVKRGEGLQNEVSHHINMHKSSQNEVADPKTRSNVDGSNFDTKYSP